MLRKSKFNYKIGDTISDWTVIGEQEIDAHGHRKHLCRCVCGYERTVSSSNLMGGKSSKCRKCVAKVNAIRIMAENDLTGRTFGFLTVMSRSHKGTGKSYDRSGTYYWKCKCICGNESLPTHSNLVAGKTQSCGHCGAISGEAHGLWKGYGQISKTYWNRVARGATDRGLDLIITIEEAWRLFESQEEKCALSNVSLNFTQGSQSSQTASLDRIDSSKGYTIDNVQWVHKDINVSKMDFDQDYFIELCHAVASTRALNPSRNYFSNYRQF